MRFNSTILKIWKMWKYPPILRFLKKFSFLFTRGKKPLVQPDHTFYFGHVFKGCKKSSVTLRNQKKHKKVFFLSREFGQKKMPAYTVKKYRLSTVKFPLVKFIVKEITYKIPRSPPEISSRQNVKKIIFPKRISNRNVKIWKISDVL